MGLRPKPHLRTFEKVLKNPKTFKKGKSGRRFLVLDSAVLRIPPVVRTWGRPVALTSSDEPRRIKPPPQARTGRCDLIHPVGRGFISRRRNNAAFRSGNDGSLQPPSGREGDREAVEGACVTKGSRYFHCNAFSPTRLRREPPPGGGLAHHRNGAAFCSLCGYGCDFMFPRRGAFPIYLY